MGQIRFVPQFDACTDRYEITATIGNDTPVQLTLVRGDSGALMQGTAGRQVRIQWRAYLDQAQTGAGDVTRVIPADSTDDFLLPPGACLP